MQIKLLAYLPLYLAAHACRMSQDNHEKSDTIEQLICNNCGNSDKGDPDTGAFEYNWSDDNLHECIKCHSSKNHWETVCGPKDSALIERVGNKFKHASILEQLVYTFDIDGISRAVLQELARHRTARLTVKSSRYTLKELKDENEFANSDIDIYGDFKHNPELKTAWYNKKTVLRASRYLVFTGDAYIDQASIKALENLRGLLYLGYSNDKAKYCMPESYKTHLQWQIDGRNLQNFLRLRSDKSALWEIRQLASHIYTALPEEHKYLYEDCMYDIVEARKSKLAEAFASVLEEEQIRVDQDQ